MTQKEYKEYVKQFNKDYFNIGGISHYDSYEWESINTILRKWADHALSLLPVKDIHTILDCGGAKGYLVEILQEKGFDAQGFDISEYAVSETRIPESFRQDDILDMKYYKTNSYDLVLAAETLEHLPEETTKKAIENLYRICKKYVVFSMPLKKNEEDTFNDGEETHINVHTREWWDKQFEGKFEYITKENLTVPVSDIHTWEFFPMKKIIKRRKK